MAYIQNNIPSPNRIFMFGLRDFSGGINNRSDTLQVTEATDLVNMAFSNDTLMEKRKGSMLYDDFKAPAKITHVNMFRPYKPDEGDFEVDPTPEQLEELDVVIRATNTEVYADKTSIKTVKSRVNGVNYMGKYFFVDGDKMYVYGKFPQFNKVYEKVIGTPTKEYVTFEIVKPPVTFTPLPIEHVRGVANYDYDKKELWYEPCQNEMEDSYSGANVLPEKPKYVAIHKGRLFVAGNNKDDDNVFISDVQNPYYFPVYLPIQLPPNSDRVRGLSVFDDGVIVGREDDMYVITGLTNNPQASNELFTLRRINTHTGVINQDCMVVAHSFFLFVGSDGEMYALSSFKSDQRQLSSQILSNQINIRRTPFNITDDELKNAVSTFHDDMWYVSFGSKVLVYSYRHKAWTMYTGIKPTAYAILDNELVWGTEGGNLVKPSENYLDMDAPYVALWKSKWLDMGEPIAMKHFRDFFLVAHAYDDALSEIEFSAEIDYSDTVGTTLIRSEVARWGFSKWGARMISRDIAQSPIFNVGKRGRIVRLCFENKYSSGLPVNTRSELDAHPNKVEGMVVKIKDENNYVRYVGRKWVDVTIGDFNQGMKIYEINGEYELRLKR